MQQDFLLLDNNPRIKISSYKISLNVSISSDYRRYAIYQNQYIGNVWGLVLRNKIYLSRKFKKDIIYPYF